MNRGTGANQAQSKHKGLLVRLVADRFVSLQTQILYFPTGLGAPTQKVGTNLYSAKCF